jgi:hypothetical protein
VAHLAILGRSGSACPLAGATHWLSLAVRDLDGEFRCGWPNG